jgi:ATP-dependent RNA helicase DeaD
MDHIRRGTLVLDKLQALVLDEADEMLRMGFIDDVEWILKHTPPTRQIALFSATMPNEVRRIAESYLQNPTIVKIASKTATASTIRQRIWEVRGMSKFAALTRMLEQQEHDAALIFVRTKTMTEELTEQLRSEGFPAAALHGDIPQAQREKIVDKLKRGNLEILVATDVVARGLDVDRITHVFNFDIPYDAESYVHRIGRTGRAGRSGDAILFVTPRERGLLRQIERRTSSTLEKLVLPTAAEINEMRAQRLKKQLVDATGTPDANAYHKLVTDLVTESGITASALAAAALGLLNSDRRFFLDENEPDPNAAPPRRERAPRPERDGKPRQRNREALDADKQRYWINVGHDHGVKPGNIVGAIANEAEINSGLIGRVDISSGFTTVDLPSNLSKAQLSQLAKARVCGQSLNIRPWSDDAPAKRSRKPSGASDAAPKRARKSSESKDAKPRKPSKRPAKRD